MCHRCGPKKKQQQKKKKKKKKKNSECRRLGHCRRMGSVPCGMAQSIKGSSVAAAAAQVTAVAQIQSLAQELPYATAVVIKKNVYFFLTFHFTF